MAGDRAYDAIIGGTTLRQVRSVQYQEQPTVVRDRQSGDFNSSAVSVVESRPEITIVTGDVDQVIDDIAPIGGLKVTAGTITIPHQQGAADGKFAAGSVHNALAATDGLAIITDISGRQGDQDGASATIALHLLSTDGTTHPVSMNTNQALAATAYNGTYDMGPVSFDPTGVGVLAELDRIVSTRVEAGNVVEKLIYGSDDYPTEVDVQEVNPRLIVGFHDLDALQTFATLIAAHDAINCFFTARADAGRHTSTASAAHIKCAFSGGVVIIDQIQSQGRGRAEVQLICEAKTLTVSAGVAITLS